jgi:hypothetical protein
MAYRSKKALSLKLTTTIRTDYELAQRVMNSGATAALCC